MKQATNASVMRSSNRKLILNLIRQGPVSRVELAEQTSLTRASVTQIVDELLEAGLVEAVSTIEHNGMGRKRTQLALCHNARYVFGVNIRRRHCEVGVVDLYGDVLAQQVLPVSGYPAAAVIRRIADTVFSLQDQLHLNPDHILGIGVSAPGPVDYKEGMLLNPPNFSAWHHIPICRMLREYTGYEVSLEKDTNSRALEEKYFGSAKNISNFMLVQIDDGVGSGVVIRDRLYRGAHGMGTEIGHISICYDGPECSCGNRGCLESYLRIPALLKDSAFDSWEALATADMHSATGTDQNAVPHLEIQQQQASAIIDRAAEYLTAALVSAINLYDLEKIILTGDVAGCPLPLTTRLNHNLQQRVLSRSSLLPIPVTDSRSLAPVRTGAMAVLRDMFQD